MLNNLKNLLGVKKQELTDLFGVAENKIESLLGINKKQGAQSMTFTVDKYTPIIQNNIQKGREESKYWEQSSLKSTKNLNQSLGDRLGISENSQIINEAMKNESKGLSVPDAVKTAQKKVFIDNLNSTAIGFVSPIKNVGATDDVGRIIDNKALDPKLVKSRLGDIAGKVSAETTNKLSTAYDDFTPLGKAIADINPVGIDSPGKFYTAVLNKLKAAGQATPQNLANLEGTTKDFFLLFKNSPKDIYADFIEEGVKQASPAVNSITKTIGYHIPGSAKALEKIKANGFNLKNFGRAGTKDAGDPRGVYFFPNKMFGGLEDWQTQAKEVGIIKKELNLAKSYIFNTEKDIEKYLKEVINPAHKSQGIQFKNIQEYNNYRLSPKTTFNSSNAITKELQKQGYDSVLDKKGILSKAATGIEEPQIIVLDLDKLNQAGFTSNSALLKGGLGLGVGSLLGKELLKADPVGGLADKQLEDVQTPITEVQFKDNKIINTNQISNQEYQSLLKREELFNKTKEEDKKILPADIESYIKNIKVNLDTNGQLRRWGNTLAIENNNPANLIYAGQPGAIKGRGGFAKFKTPELGFRAAVKQVEADQKRSLTLKDFIYKYSPPHENDTAKYLNYLENTLGITKKDKINTLDPIEIAKAVVWFESQTKVQEL